jgi:hypothetical protein
MHVGDVVLGLAGGACLRYGLALVDAVPTLHEEWTEMRERRLVTARGDDRHRRPVRRNLARERDLAHCRSANDAPVVERDVDPSVLPARVRVVADGVPAEHRAVGRPCPRERVGCRDEQPAERSEDDGNTFRCPSR